MADKDMSINKKICYWERQRLSPFACLAENTKGRQLPEPKSSMRTDFQRDRDRIIHCKAFRRLKHKTQVFLSPEGDHYRTRLTHTLEVAQIARTIARALDLNEDLTEAVALGHDLGHTPFGHAGERALNELYPEGFRHYEQSVRVVDRLEKDGAGLNLCYEVRDGILCHTRGEQAKTLEGRIVRIADRIAYINHDIDDAIRAGALTENEIPKRFIEVFGSTTSKRINSMVTNVVENSKDGEIRMEAEFAEHFSALHKFMFDYVYKNEYAKFEEKKVPGLVEGLYRYFVKHPKKLDGELLHVAETEGVERAVCDYIAGMTDQYAVQVYESLFIPRPWQKL